MFAIKFGSVHFISKNGGFSPSQKDAKTFKTEAGARRFIAKRVSDGLWTEGDASRAVVEERN